MREFLNRIRPEPGSRFDVLGLGGCSLDELWRLPSDADLLDQSASAVIHARARDQIGGGAVATTMVACRRLGLRAGFCGAVGVDEPGRAVVHGLRDEGVDTSAVRMLGQARTRCTLTLQFGDERRSAIAVHDPTLILPEGVPSQRDVDHARILHVDLCFPQAAERAARACRQTHGAVSLSLCEDSYRSEGAPSAQTPQTPKSGPVPLSAQTPSALLSTGPADARAVDALLAHADLCVMTSNFAQRHTGVADFERALVTLARRTPAALLVATLGERGCVAVDREESGERLIYCPAVPVMAGADRTGCGGAFRAALLAFLLRSAAQSPRPLEDALRFANAAAALKCRALGRRGCPTWREVDHLVSGALPETPILLASNPLRG